MSNPWFRMYHEFYKDPVMQCLAFEDQRHYVVLLCMKCDGLLDRELSPANRNRLIYRGLGLDPNSAEEAKRRLLELNLITKDWQPRNWEKRQYQSDNSTVRARKSRKNKESGNVANPLPQQQTSVAATPPDTDTDTEKKKNAPKALTFSQWMKTIPEDQDAIPFNHHVFKYAQKVGISTDVLTLAWCWFEKHYSADEKGKRKRYTDWPGVFRKAVEGNWGKLWWVNQEGEYQLTTPGIQLQREMKSEAV